MSELARRCLFVKAGKQSLVLAERAPPPRSGRRWLRCAASKSEGALLASNAAKTWSRSACTCYAMRVASECDHRQERLVRELRSGPSPACGRRWLRHEVSKSDEGSLALKLRNIVGSKRFCSLREHPLIRPRCARPPSPPRGRRSFASILGQAGSVGATAMHRQERHRHRATPATLSPCPHQLWAWVWRAARCDPARPQARSTASPAPHAEPSR